MVKVTSIVTDDLDTCYVCGRPRDDIHHCIHGWANRKLSDKYHLVVGLCTQHHYEVHNGNVELDRMIQRAGQRAFEQAYPDLNFREIFGKNY